MRVYIRCSLLDVLHSASTSMFLFTSIAFVSISLRLCPGGKKPGWMNLNGYSQLDSSISRWIATTAFYERRSRLETIYHVRIGRRLIWDAIQQSFLSWLSWTNKKRISRFDTSSAFYFACSPRYVFLQLFKIALHCIAAHSNDIQNEWIINKRSSKMYTTHVRDFQLTSHF